MSWVQIPSLAPSSFLPLVKTLRPPLNARVESPRILCVGEIIWDIIGHREHLGGAPCNVAVHAARLGARAAMWSAVGRDARGRRAIEELRKLGVRWRWIDRVSHHPTGWAQVRLDEQGRASYSFAPRPAYEWLRATPTRLRAIVRWRPHAIVFGTLAQRGEATRQALGALLDRCGGALRVYDVNLRRGFAPPELLRARLCRTDVLKLNEDEATEVSRRLWGRWPGEEKAAARWREEFAIRIVIVTRGANGATAWSAEGRIDVTGLRIRLADTVGAGDAFTAAFTVAYLQTGEISWTLRVANRLGAFVASRPGATPPYPAGLLQRLGLRPTGSVRDRSRQTI
ncbi:MAG: carbohydrate kinase [Kiritimatiellae bacterium]|nr:carbohydrate kinase [Kiritimatiellia bacterium]